MPSKKFIKPFKKDSPEYINHLRALRWKIMIIKNFKVDNYVFFKGQIIKNVPLIKFLYSKGFYSLYFCGISA